MNSVALWSRRIGVSLAVLVAAVLSPTVASAHGAYLEVDAVDTLGKGKALAATGGLGLLCCLLVVAAAAVPVVLLIQRRRR